MSRSRRLLAMAVAACALAASLPAAAQPKPAGTAFVDVPENHRFVDDIGWAAETGVTRGCNPPANDRFCPDRPVTRGEMAALLRRAMRLWGKDVTAGGPSSFVDVAESHVFADDIAWLAAAGVTRGCNPPAGDRFCPDAAISRGQLAAMLVRALNLPAPETKPAFTDVKDNHFFAGDIAALADAGVTRGCGQTAEGDAMFCPNRAVTRAEAAAFLHRLDRIADRYLNGTGNTGNTDNKGDVGNGGDEGVDEGGEDAPTLEVEASVSQTVLGGEPVDLELSAYVSGGVPPYAYTSDDLPAGLTLDGDGRISGHLPEGTYRFVVQVSDQARQSGEIVIDIEVVAEELTITTEALSSVEAGTEEVSITLGAKGGTPPYVWSAAGLPEGLEMTADGTIEGVVLDGGTYDIEVTVTDADGETAERTLQMVATSPALCVNVTDVSDWECVAVAEIARDTYPNATLTPPNKMCSELIWSSVMAECQDGHIILLEISANLFDGAYGEVSPSLAKLTRLWQLSYPSGTQIVAGEIPEELGNLTSLRTMDIRGQNLTGGIPQSFAGLDSLQHMYLGGNRLEGNIDHVVEHLSDTLMSLMLNNNGCFEASAEYHETLNAYDPNWGDGCPPEITAEAELIHYNGTYTLTVTGGKGPFVWEMTPEATSSLYLVVDAEQPRTARLVVDTEPTTLTVTIRVTDAEGREHEIPIDIHVL